MASASKLVSALVLMRLVSGGLLSLSSTTGDVLGWSQNASISLDNLGSFTSGFAANPGCTHQVALSLSACVAQIRQNTASYGPGERFVYGSAHLHVAAQFAQQATGKTWQRLADDELFAPLGIKNDALHYVTRPQQNMGITNPLIAGGLIITPREYAIILALLFHRGMHGAQRLIGASSIDRFRRNQYQGAVVAMADSPLKQAGYDFYYGFGSWLECAGPVSPCDKISSTGRFGFTPWLDYENGYYAILAMNTGGPPGAAFSMALEQRLQPLILDLLR